MAGPVDWPVSVRSISDWVTPLRTSSRTCMQLFLINNYLSSLFRECGCATGSSLSNKSRLKTPDICCPRHTWCIEGYLFRSSIIVILIIWYCFGVFRVRDMASDGLPDREQAVLLVLRRVPCHERFWDLRWTFGRRGCMIWRRTFQM